MNADALQRVLLPQGFMIVAQNFGCVLHKEGSGLAEIDTPSVQCHKIKEFLADRHQLEDVIKP